MAEIAGADVLVWGFGRHGGGLAAARFCAAHGARVRILDAKPLEALGVDGAAAIEAGWPSAVGDGSHPWLGEVDLIVPSPAIPPRAWPARHAPVRSPEALALAAHRGRRIAVTGTKGKSTTAMITAALLGWEACGNSFEPILSVLSRRGPEVDLVVELSSFQLHYLAADAPRFDAVICTSLAVDHLDWHGSVAAYHAAKLALLDWTERRILGSGVPGNGLDLATCGDGRFLGSGGPFLGNRADLGLRGEHNVRNACLALTAALVLGATPAEIRARLPRIRALPHRLQVVHRGRWTWIDDSIATTPEACQAALAAVEGPVGLIAGGADKGATWEVLARIVRDRGAEVACIGRTGAALAAAIGDRARDLRTLSEAVADLVRRVPAGGIILLSPACSSLDQFTSFEERGWRFLDLARSTDPG